MASQKLKVAVVGAGGTGAYYGGALAKAGHDVTFIARGSHLDAINKSGLQLNTVLLGDFHLDSPATDDMSSIGPVDLVIFAVKSWGTETAIADMAGLVGNNTLIISTQNGIDSERLLSDAFGKEHVLGCTATVSSMITSPGVVTQAGGPGSLVVGALTEGQSARVNDLATQCVAAGIAAETHENIELAIWEKFTFICALSGMTALTRKPIGEIFAQESTTQMYLQVLSEVAEVGRASGIPLPQSIAADLLATTQAREPFIIGSMGHDLIANNPIEISLLNARVVELGTKHNIKTPANFAIEAALRPHEFGGN
ncbi:MAG: 2-dehydropantoate 2-reductase [SAR202 cluster bacterium]|nr:MAG: 2-dehydropantoate 2-reductase [SAR202 cluster bacterium]KAA1300876.1 MAG: 2-dehydropantoate 2-reductase [SAR202 cluster bacterium]KAA1303661.1 MAG: 2-dehydropantoate 2-reductase [SAR202 cluster bacterium]MCH2529922.1 2-dehydropantoate 2-reductase [Dehalococcoidia bacterium]MQG89897.1 2-dehydropantoate 2-reductase [SAR202 cluster bacterium]